MRVITKHIEVSGRADWVNIVLIGDEHIGNSGCQEDKIKEHIKWIKHKPDTYWIGMGDCCFDEETEILTVNGWKKGTDLSLSENIIQYEPNTKRLRPCNILKYIKFNYNGNMIKIDGKNVDQFITPEHRVLYNNTKVSRAFELVGRKKYLNIPTAGIYFNRISNTGYRSSSRISDTMIKLIGWLVTEGWIEKRGNHRRIAISQSKIHTDYVMEIEDCFKKLKFYPHRRINSENVITWRLRGFESEKVLRYFDNNDVHRIPRKLLNQEYKKLKILFETLMKGDGTISRNTYSTIRYELAKDFSELCSKIGYATTIGKRQNKNPNWKDIYSIYISKYNFDKVREIKEQEYKGFVWCVKVSSGFIMIRRNGKISISGNCEFITPRDKRWDSGSLASWVEINMLSELPKYQAKRYIKLYEPIKDKCLGLLEGNHEYTIHKYYDNNVHKYICEELGIESLSFMSMIRLKFHRKNSKGSRQIDLWLCHGSGNAQTLGGKLNKLQKQTQSFSADFYCMGHMHQKVSEKIVRLFINQEGKLEEKSMIICATPSFFKTYVEDKTSYGERAMYSPASTGVLKLQIKPFVVKYENGKHIDIKPNIHISG